MDPHHNDRGSLWHRWDLHFHTPGSFDYHDRSVTDQDIIDCLLSNDVRVVAITDHHDIDVKRIENLRSSTAGRVTVLAGIELRDDHGGEAIHYICIFPETQNLQDIWTKVQGTLGLTPSDIRSKGGNEKIYVSIGDAARLTRELNGVVSIHAGVKTNSIESIKNKEQFQQRIKYDITNKHVDIMEVGQIKDIDVHLHTIFPATDLDRPLVLCSDNHDARSYTPKANLWLRADPCFRGLLMALKEPRERIFIGDRPEELIRLNQNSTKYIRSISFTRKPTVPPGQLWFQGTVEFNPGLVAIIGNKGCGKSALSDSIGLLGGTKNEASFSFLGEERFRHPVSGYAEHFSAALQWESGDGCSRDLSDMIASDEIETIKYLPQNHVEKVCNELSGTSEGGFEQELKSVIFSHVPGEKRLGCQSLEDLIKFRTDEKQSRIDTLLKELKDLSRTRAILESRANPKNRRELERKLEQRKADLAALDGAEPGEVADPSADSRATPVDKGLLDELAREEEAKSDLQGQIEDARERLGRAERRKAVANRLSERLGNFEQEYLAFKDSLADDTSELGLDADSILTVSINRDDVDRIGEEAAAEVLGIQKELDAASPVSLLSRLQEAESKINVLQAQLDAPNRLYQTYLKDEERWKERRASIVGNEKDPNSLNGIKALLKDLDSLPEKIAEVRKKQEELAQSIQAQKIAQADVYRTLYEPVQRFIDSHGLGKVKLELEFRVELSNLDFIGRFLELIAQNRKGSFMGADEGRIRAQELVVRTRWDEWESVRSFFSAIDEALHRDMRSNGKLIPTELSDQLLRGKKPEDVFDLLYGLEYVRPRYVLKWEGKDLPMLSPGERGTLLLIFYLLIDRGDMPLVIDQPEGNLDNHTIVKVLVECIREARKKRQVFIVTHNPNLAVVSDADQVIHASIDKVNGNMITYTAGSLENPKMSEYVTDVLEGTRWAFRVRGDKYDIGERRNNKPN